MHKKSESEVERTRGEVEAIKVKFEEEKKQNACGRIMRKQNMTERNKLKQRDMDTKPMRWKKRMRKTEREGKKERERERQTFHTNYPSHNTMHPFYNSIMMLNVGANRDQNKQLPSYATSPWKQLINIHVATRRV